MRLSFLLLAAIATAVLIAWTRTAIAPGTAISLSFRGGSADARISAIRDLSHYSLYVIETGDGPICGVAGDAPVAAIPLRGQWNDRGDWSPEGTTLACADGAIGKCVIWGYRPWEPGMRNYHQACIRMVRADYCGDGVGHTRDGTPIDVWDARGIVRPDDVSGMMPEAEWGPDGATHVRRTRYPSGMDYILRHCSDRIGGTPRNRPWLLANASYPEPR